MKTYIKSIRLDSKALAQRVDLSRKTDFIKCISAAMRLTEFYKGSMHDFHAGTFFLDPSQTVDITNWGDPVISWAAEPKKLSICCLEQSCPRILAPENATFRRAIRVLNVLLIKLGQSDLEDYIETFQSA